MDRILNDAKSGFFKSHNCWFILLVILIIHQNRNYWVELLTLAIEVTLINWLWFGEHVSSQKRFKKFLKHAGQPTRKGIACRKSRLREYKFTFIGNQMHWSHSRLDKKVTKSDTQTTRKHIHSNWFLHRLSRNDNAYTCLCSSSFFIIIIFFVIRHFYHQRFNIITEQKSWISYLLDLCPQSVELCLCAAYVSSNCRTQTLNFGR